MPTSLGLRALNVNGATSSDPNAGDDFLVHYCQGKLILLYFTAVTNKFRLPVAALIITVYDHRT